MTPEAGFESGSSFAATVVQIPLSAFHPSHVVALVAFGWPLLVVGASISGSGPSTASARSSVN